MQFCRIGFFARTIDFHVFQRFVEVENKNNITTLGLIFLNFTLSKNYPIMFTYISAFIVGLCTFIYFAYPFYTKRTEFKRKFAIHELRTRKADGCQACGRRVYPGEMIYACGKCEEQYRW